MGPAGLQLIFLSLMFARAVSKDGDPKAAEVEIESLNTDFSPSKQCV